MHTPPQPSSIHPSTMFVKLPYASVCFHTSRTYVSNKYKNIRNILYRDISIVYQMIRTDVLI